MAQSIRWRLVMGTMLLTLLTVSAVGVVALLLMQRYMVQQERAYLTANAQAIAQQAADFMTPARVAPPLQQLAQTAAFLSDVNVRIVDDAQMPLADSAVMTHATTATSMVSPVYFRVAPPHSIEVEAVPGEPLAVKAVPAEPVLVEPVPVELVSVAAVPGSDPSIPNMVWTLAAQEATAETTEAISTTNPFAGREVVGQEANVIVVQKSPSFWGDRLIFKAESVPASGVISATMPTAAGAPIYYEIKQFAPGGVAQVDEVRMAGEVSYEAIVAGKEVAGKGGAGKEAVGKDMWRTEKSLTWQKSVAAGAGVMAQPTFLQAVGFQPLDSVMAPIETGGSVIGFVELARATTLTDEPLGAIRRALGIAAGASSLLAIAVGLVMSRTLTAPIQNLAEAAAAMSSGDLTARAPVTGRDELAALARQFNQMADALHLSFVELAAERDTLRRFVADASHELRTPITALRTFNELLQGPAQADRVAQAEFLAESHAQIARLEWITRNLLDLSRWDGGMATLARADVEVGELVMATAAPFRALAQERQIALNVIVPETTVVVNVDEQRLGMVVGNLLDNALKFTPCEGQIEVGVCQDEQGVKIWVGDTGMGIGAEELPRIFERFYRSPRATQAGSGLGLAIVERIVKAHGATIQVESQEGMGSRFTVYIRNTEETLHFKEGVSMREISTAIL